MSHRITQKDLENILDRINSIAGTDHEGTSKGWIKNLEDGTFKANVGAYVLDYAYGGVRLSQITSKGGGERDITGRGTKKETYYNMLAFLYGFEAGLKAGEK
tara:strand:- start:590 stop:895 length:306 start_codon:yes stop_codon:yes gene_type:complete